MVKQPRRRGCPCLLPSHTRGAAAVAFPSSRRCRILLVASPLPPPSSRCPLLLPHLSSRRPHHPWLDVDGNVGVCRCVSSHFLSSLCVSPWDATRHRRHPFCSLACVRHSAPFPPCVLGCDTMPPLSRVRRVRSPFSVFFFFSFYFFIFLFPGGCSPSLTGTQGSPSTCKHEGQQSSDIVAAHISQASLEVPLPLHSLASPSPTLSCCPFNTTPLFSPWPGLHGPSGNTSHSADVFMFGRSRSDRCGGIWGLDVGSCYLISKYQHEQCTVL